MVVLTSRFIRSGDDRNVIGSYMGLVVACCYVVLSSIQEVALCIMCWLGITSKFGVPELNQSYGHLGSWLVLCNLAVAIVSCEVVCRNEKFAWLSLFGSWLTLLSKVGFLVNLVGFQNGSLLVR